MSTTKRPAEIKSQGDLLKLLATTSGEVDSFMQLQARLAQERREKKFPLGVERAIRDHLVLIFKKEHIDIRAAALAKLGMGGGGFRPSGDKANEPISYEGVNADFDRRIAARHREGFVAEHTFLATATVLVGFARNTIREIVLQDPLHHCASTTTMLEDTLKVLGEIKDKLPGYTPSPKRKRSIVVPGDTLNHNSSVEFLHEAIYSCLKQSLEMVELAERTIKEEQGKNTAKSATEIVQTHERFQWVRDLITLILSLFASLNRNQATEEKTPALPASAVQEPKLPEPLQTMSVTMEMLHTSLSALLVQLEANPSSFLSEELEDLAAIAATAQEAKKSPTTQQT